MKRKTMTSLFCTALIAASLCGAADASTAVTAQLDPHVTVQIDGTARTFYNVQGQEVHPIVYRGTTYLPIRSIAELMDRNVDWNNASNTVTIGGKRTTGNPVGTPDYKAKKTDITFYLSPEITVVIDGTVRTFYDADGKQVDPAVYNGSIYLPIRSIGEMMNKTVAWDGKTQTVILRTAPNGNVTDYDTQSGGNTTPAPSKDVTLEQAKQTALNHAGKTAAEVTFVKEKKDFQGGRWVYEIGFVAKRSGKEFTYDYTIEASTGKILSSKQDAEDTTPARPTEKPVKPGQTGISEQAAKQIALARVPGATAANIFEFEREFDDGRWEYEGKIVYREMEYEFTIDASTGAVLEWEAESVDD